MCRATSRADVNAPVGCDTHGYAYRSGGGEKIHDAKREPYGTAFREGDVVGMYLSLGAAGQRKARGAPRGAAMRQHTHWLACGRRWFAPRGSQRAMFSASRESGGVPAAARSLLP